MIKRILVATSLLCMCCILFAQTVQVKGKVVSENEAVEFANVVLQTKDSIFIAGGVTDSKGRFMMENIQAGSYLLCISGMGYTSRIISLDHLAVSKDLGVIMISPESILLKEVVVTGIIRKSKFPQNPKRSVRFSGKRTKRSVQKRKARNTQKAETKVL